MKSPAPEETLFQAAIALAPDCRTAYLDHACAGNPALRARLDALLAAHDQNDTLVDAGLSSLLPTVSSDVVQDSNEANLGKTFGPYHLLARLGEGGCGVVYFAEQTGPLRRRVALKLIKPGMDSKGVIARFEAERQALAMMDHPNIAKVLDAGTTDMGRPYFVMELVSGIRITEYCDQEKLPVRDRVHLFIKVCQAIQHAHQKGVIHRDIKPSNILVTRQDGVAFPKVIDFGIAKATEGRLTEATVSTQLHQLLGTPAYMSPEQSEMGGVDIDTRSDIYSLGVLLYELLTGVTPFDAKEVLSMGLDAMRRAIREVEPIRPSARLTQLMHHRPPGRPTHRHAPLPTDLDWVVMKCLEKDRARRYETASGLASDLRRHLDHQPVEARAPGAVYRLQKAWQRHRLAFSVGVSLAGVLLATVVILSKSLREQRLARESAENARKGESLQLANAEAARAAASLARDHAALLLAATHAAQGVERLEKSDPIGFLYLLEARKTVDHLPAEKPRFTRLWSGWMEAWPKPEIRTLPISGPLRSLAFSPSQPWIATGETNGEVALWHAETGKEIGRFDTGGTPVFSQEFSGNSRLLIVQAGGAHQLWDLGRAGTNSWPHRLRSRVLRYAFDPARRILVTLANEGMPLPGENPRPRPQDTRTDLYRLEVWNAQVDDPLVTTWGESRLDLANHQFAVSSDGTTLATAGDSVILWNLANGQRRSIQIANPGTSGNRGFFDPLCFSPNGRWLWEVRGRDCVRYDVATGKPSGDLISGLHHRARPWLSDNGKNLLASFDAGHRVIDLDTGEFLGPPIAREEESAGTARALTFDGHILATAGSGRGLMLWNTRTGKSIGPPVMVSDGIADAEFSPEGAWLSMVTRDGNYQIRRVTPPDPTTFRAWPGSWFIGLNPQGQALVYTTSNRLVQWMEPWTGARTGTGWDLGDPGNLYGAALSSDGHVLATVTSIQPEASAIRRWNTMTGLPLDPPITWTNVGTLAFNSDGGRLAGLGGDGSIHVWDSVTGELQSTMAWPQPPQVTWIGIRFSPDSRFLAARNSYAISVWDMTERRLANGKDRDFYLAISRDWTLALTDRDLLDFRDPQVPIPAPRPPTTRGAAADRGGFAISSDNRLRAATVGNKSVRLWDNVTGRPVGREMRCEGVPTQMEFSPDNRLLVVKEFHFEARPRSPRYSIRLWETSQGLPCGLAMPLDEDVVEFWFDLERRLFGYSTLFDPDGMRVFRLPAGDRTLADMERETRQLTGSRLDETGNIERL
ncbi:MAG: protein kinase [Verrucomicrobiales bacterium]|nr:protein kinase [Verrucomicrobiales bacterium]